jgi:predicted acetyltransferase
MKLQELGMNDRALDLRRGTDADFETIERLHRENGRDHNGNTERDEQFWPRVREPWYRKPHVFLVDGDTGPEGYVIYHQKINEHDHPDLWLFDLVARTKGAARRLLTFFRDHRSTCDYVAWNGHPADPLLLQAIEQGHEVRLRDIWMLRLTHVKNALEARGYALGVEGELHLDVADDVCPGNGGRLVLHVHGGKAQVEPGGEGRIAIDVRALASIYAGYASPGQIRTAWGLQASDEDLDRLGGVFAGQTPWMQDMF